MNRTLRFATLAIGLLLPPAGSLVTARPLAGQITPADSAAVLVEAARRFERSGRPDVAEALYRDVVERFGSTPAAEAARARLVSLPEAFNARGGRVELEVWGTTYGLWLGAAIPAALGADQPEAYGAGLLLGGPAALLAARAVSRSHPMSEGQVRAITWGGTWGTWQGFGWTDVLDIGEDEVCNGDVCYVPGDNNEERFAGMIVGGAVGIATGALIARHPVRLGVASGAHYGSLWGTWLGAAGSALADADGNDALALTLVGGDLGLIAGGLLARHLDMSRNRVRLISLGGLVGGLGGAGLDLLVQPDDAKVAISIPLLASLVGLGLGAHLTRDFDVMPRPGDGGGGTALLEYDRGWRLGPPFVVPSFLPASAGGRRHRVPRLTAELLHARF